jgi:hypothetical protein
MLRTSLWNDRVSRVVLDYRSREAHLRLERIANDCLCRVPQRWILGSGGPARRAA